MCINVPDIYQLFLTTRCVFFVLFCFFFHLSSQCGFFKRSKQDSSVPRYHAVRIRKETPEYKDGKVKLDPFEKKQWMTTWIDNESYSWCIRFFFSLQASRQKYTELCLLCLHVNMMLSDLTEPVEFTPLNFYSVQPMTLFCKFCIYLNT